MKRVRLTPLDVGIVPADWPARPIDEIVELLTNGFVGPSLPHQTSDALRGIRYLQGFNIRPNMVDLRRKTWVTEEFHKRNAKSQLRRGDVLVVQSGHVGTAAVVPASLEGANCHALIIIRFHKEIAPDFAAQYLNSEVGRARLRGLEVGSSLPHINTSELGKFRLPIPTLAEQGRIAGALALWDEAIEKSGRLVEAAALRHQALVKRLLLQPGFPAKALGDLALPVRRKNVAGNGHPLTVSGQEGLVSQLTFFDKRIAADATEHYTLLKRGEFAYNRSYSQGYPYGAIKRLDRYDEGVVSSLYLCFALRPESPVLSDYLTYFCEAGGFNRQLHQVAQEGARNHGLLNVPAGDFFSMKLPLPALNEQRRIVALLTASARELATLRRMLDATQRQKRGLMQRLLAGTWRLPVLEAEAA